MKKAFLAIVLIAIIGIESFAQNAGFGFQAGATLATMRAKVNDETESSDSKFGFTAGVLADIQLAESFTFQPALNFTQKGGETEESIGNITETMKTSLSYIELPLNFLYNCRAGNGKFFIGLGPALGYGITGKFKTKITDGSNTVEDESDVEFGDDENEDHFKAFEFSGNILAGYQCENGIFVAANYNMGFSNLLPGDPDDNSLKNRYFGLRIGYKLGGANK